MSLNFWKANGIKHTRAIKLDIRILVVSPKLGTNKAKAAIDIMLKTNKGRAARSRLMATKAPFVIKNSKKYQGIVSVKTNNCR